MATLWTVLEVMTFFMYWNLPSLIAENNTSKTNIEVERERLARFKGTEPVAPQTGVNVLLGGGPHPPDSNASTPRPYGSLSSHFKLSSNSESPPTSSNRNATSLDTGLPYLFNNVHHRNCDVEHSSTNACQPVPAEHTQSEQAQGLLDHSSLLQTSDSSSDVQDLSASSPINAGEGFSQIALQEDASFDAISPLPPVQTTRNDALPSVETTRKESTDLTLSFLVSGMYIRTRNPHLPC